MRRPVRVRNVVLTTTRTGFSPNPGRVEVAHEVVLDTSTTNRAPRSRPSGSQWPPPGSATRGVASNEGLWCLRLPCFIRPRALKVAVVGCRCISMEAKSFTRMRCDRLQGARARRGEKTAAAGGPGCVTRGEGGRRVEHRRIPWRCCTVAASSGMSPRHYRMPRCGTGRRKIRQHYRSSQPRMLTHSPCTNSCRLTLRTCRRVEILDR